MKVEWGTARSGRPFVRVDGRALHSPYDPGREAERFARQFRPRRPASLLILIGDATGEPAARLVAAHPDARVVRVDPLRHVPGQIRRMVREAIEPVELVRAEALTWPPVTDVLPAWSDQAHAAVAAAIADLQAEVATIAGFGRRWLSNALHHALRHNERTVIEAVGEVCAVAASGPSLAALGAAEAARMPVVAATSGARRLAACAIRPDLLLHTDGGIWSARYLEVAARSTLLRSVPIALPVNATPTRTPAPLLLATGSLGERLAVDAPAWQALPEEPTVGAALVRLASSLMPRAHLLLYGLDLCSRDLLTHARPHPNDRYIASRATRLASETSIRFARALGAGPSERLEWDDGVGAWRDRTLARYDEPVFRAVADHRVHGAVGLPSPSPVWDEPPCAVADLAGGGRLDVRRVPRPPYRERLRHARAELGRWRDMAASLGTPAAERDDADANQRLALLLHLAPVETLAWSRSDLGPGDAVAAAARALDRLAERVRDG